MVEDINELLERLNFSEEKSIRVISTNKNEAKTHGYEAWAVGKIMAKEKINREAMYRVLKSLWFTKEEVSFVALNGGVILVKFGNIEDRTRILNLMPWLFDQCLFAMLPFIKGQEIDAYEFNITPLWIRIYNIPLEHMVRQVAIDVGKAIGEVVANGGWAEFIRLRVKVDVLRPLRRVVHLIETNNLSFQHGSWFKAQGGFTQNRGNWRNGIEILDKPTNSNEANNESKTGTREENKILTQKGKARDGDEGSESNLPLEKRLSNHEVLLLELLRAWKPFNSSRAQATSRRSGGLAMLWKDGADVVIATVLIRLEDWLVGGDFNAVIDDTEKERGGRKPRVHLEEFRDVLEELALVDIKIDRGWFTWVNNQEGGDLVKRRLDRFVMSANAISNLPLIVTNVIRQDKSDHDAVMMDTMGRKPREDLKDPRLFFKFDACRAKDRVAKDIIKIAWSRSGINIMENLRGFVGSLIIDDPYEMSNADSFKEAPIKLRPLYAEEEGY
ncbi:hypothetical protein Gotri_007708 [Gossypium trilobum]|uniref:DUF4283 domain-containing protein n=1 Tax=Gossypium trilobum TaxID=34281 RepID=A0A7J9EGZ4_9ROSI|nr:hypothetical protein [Gossypium trilobum]